MVGITLGVYNFGLIFVSARTNKRHHHTTVNVAQVCEDNHKIIVVLQLQDFISSFHQIMQESESFKSELTPQVPLSQSITASTTWKNFLQKPVTQSRLPPY
jgi:hypothetical protein